jgi:hypothetical protein
MPAFMAAVAASECGEEEVAMLREAEGDWFREVPLDAAGEARGEGGSELISGGMVAGLMAGWWCDGPTRWLT